MDSVCLQQHCKKAFECFVYSLAIFSTTSLITLVVLMDYKKCINTPLNTTYIFQDHTQRT